MVRFFKKEQEEVTEQKPQEAESPGKVSEDKDARVEYVEREITLALLNYKLNEMTNLLVDIREKLNSKK